MVALIQDADRRNANGVKVSQRKYLINTSIHCPLSLLVWQCPAYKHENSLEWTFAHYEPHCVMSGQEVPYFVFAKYFHRASSGMFEVHYKLRWILYSTTPLAIALDLYGIWGMKQTPMLQDDNCYCGHVFLCSHRSLQLCLVCFGFASILSIFCFLLLVDQLERD